MAELPRDGREYFRWPILTAPDDAEFEAYVGGEWVEAERVDGSICLLLEGPDVPTDLKDPDAVILPQTASIRFRVKNITPEIVIRAPGTIYLR